MSELTEAAADILEILVDQMGAGATVTVRRRTEGALDAITGVRSYTESDTSVSALKVSGERVAFPTGAFEVAADRITYFVAAADLAFTPDENDEVIDGGDTHTIRSVREAMGGAVLALEISDQEII